MIEPDLEALYREGGDAFARLHINAALRRYLPTLRNSLKKLRPAAPTPPARDPQVIYAKMIDKAAERFVRAKRAHELREGGMSWSAIGIECGAKHMGKILWWKYQHMVELRDIADQCASMAELYARMDRYGSLPAIYWTLEGIRKAEGKPGTGWGATPTQFRDMQEEFWRKKMEGNR